LKLRWIMGWILALGVWGCTTEMSLSSVASDLRAERIDDAVRKIDEIAARKPNSFDVQYARGVVHGQAALRSLSAKDEPAYVKHVEAALQSYARASAFDPRQAEPHTGVGLLLLYQGNLPGALEEMRVARMLEPVNPVTYANLAQVYVYMGRLSRARTTIEKGRKMGLPPVYAETVEMLASWRQGDLTDAHDLFDMANQDAKAMREFLQDDPNVPADFKSFDEMAKYCCNSATCGPNMGDACKEMELEVKRRQVAAETLRLERAAALASQRELRKTYGGRREVEIEGEEDEGGKAEKADEAKKPEKVEEPAKKPAKPRSK
jgi:Tfp pilus assembly protein PilF